VLATEIKDGEPAPDWDYLFQGSAGSAGPRPRAPYLAAARSITSIIGSVYSAIWREDRYLSIG